MRRGTFLAFVGPSLISMTLLIAMPLGLVLWQSFHLTQDVMERRIESACDPFGCTEKEVIISTLDATGNVVRTTKFVGLENYRLMLGWQDLKHAITAGDLLATLSNIDFFRALRFTLTFTLVTLPLVLVIGLALALAINRTFKRLRGPVIFFSLCRSSSPR